MNSAYLAAIALLAFYLGYRFYSRFISDKIYGLDDKLITPAHECEDGVDFVPTKRHILFGHHFTSIAGAILFGSIASIISTRLRSSEGFNVIINTVFLFFAFVSTAFYPAAGAPEPLATAFYLNPLTYLVDIIRAGIFGAVTEFVILEMIVLVSLASVLFVIATKLLTKLDF